MVTFVKSIFTRHWNDIILSCLVVKYDIFPGSTLQMYIALQDSIFDQKDLQDVTFQHNLINFMCIRTTNDWSTPGESIRQQKQNKTNQNKRHIVAVLIIKVSTNNLQN